MASANDTVLMLVLDMKVGEAQGMLNLCLPASIVEKTDEHFAGAWDRHRREPTGQERRWLLENLGRVPMPVQAVIDSRCRARDLVGLAPGDVLALDVPVQRAVDVRVGDTLKFRGRLGAAGRRTHVRIDFRCDGAGVPETGA